MVSDCGSVLDTLGHVFAFALLMFAGGMYPLGLMLGAPCSPCCGRCSKCNYVEHTTADLDSVQITGGSFTLTHPGFGSSVSSSVQPGLLNRWTRSRVASGGTFSPNSDIKESFMNGCLADSVASWIANGGTRASFKAELFIGLLGPTDIYPFGDDGTITASGEVCDIYSVGVQIVVLLQLVDDALWGIVRQSVELGRCTNEATVTAPLESVDEVSLFSPLGGLSECHQQLTDFCLALTMSGSFTHGGCLCGACCSYDEGTWSLEGCDEDIAEGACRDDQFKYFPGVELCADAECPDYREF